MKLRKQSYTGAPSFATAWLSYGTNATFVLASCIAAQRGVCFAIFSASSSFAAWFLSVAICFCAESMTIPREAIYDSSSALF